MSLVSHWKLDEQTGTSIADSAGTNTGTWVGTELVTNGDFATNDLTGWAQSASGYDASTGEAVFTMPGTPATEYLGQDFGVVIGTRYTVSFDITASTLDHTGAAFGLSVSGRLETSPASDRVFTASEINAIVAGSGTVTLDMFGVAGVSPVNDLRFFVGESNSVSTSIAIDNVSVREQVSSVPAPDGTGLLFDGVGDVISVLADPSITLTDSDFTLSAWVNPLSDGEADAGRIFQKGSNLLWLSGSTPVVKGQVSYSGGLDIDATSQTVNSVPLGSWMQIAMVMDLTSKIITLYVNGMAVEQTQVAGQDTVSDDSLSDLFIGSNDDTVPARTFDGSIDDVRIYDTALTADEILELYNSYSNGLLTPFKYITYLK